MNFMQFYKNWKYLIRVTKASKFSTLYFFRMILVFNIIFIIDYEIIIFVFE